MQNQIFNEDCLITIPRMISDNVQIDGIITSPPYGIVGATKRKDCYYNNGYTNIDNIVPNDWLQLRLLEFIEFEKILKFNGVICYNLSYCSAEPSLPQRLISSIEHTTQLSLVDIIYWKKDTAIPFQTSPRHLSRIIEPIYIFTHINDVNTYVTNKQIAKINERTGQKFYKNYINFIEARNNDGVKTNLKAAFSVTLVEKLLDIYFPEGSVIYDPFMGIGTTAVACIINNRKYIGSEITKEFYNQSIERINAM